MKKRTALLSFYLFLGLLLAAQSSAQDQAFKADLLFEISTASDEHLLSGPSHISTDSEGNIYVADYYTSDVKQFDSDGAYQRTIGRRGRGPGEFLRITEIHIGHDEKELYVELFDEELRLQTYGTVQGLDYRYFSIEHYADGRFYGIGLRKEEIPVVVVFEMEAVP